MRECDRICMCVRWFMQTHKYAVECEMCYGLGLEMDMQWCTRVWGRGIDGWLGCGDLG